MNDDAATMQELISSFADRGDRSCLLWFEEQGSDSLTYARFADLARGLARGLAARDIGPGQRVAVFAENRWQTVVLAAGALLAGAAITPIDPQFSGDILAHVLTDAAPALLLATNAQARAVRDAVGEPGCPVLITEEDEDEGEDSWRTLIAEDGAEPARAGPEDTAALFYTSGTTGRPKGVPLSHANLVFQMRALREAGLISPEDRMLAPLPLHHVYPFVVGTFAPLALGLCLILPRAVTGPEVVRAAREGRATIIVGVPRLYEALVKGVMDRIDALGFPARQAVRLLLAVSRLGRIRLGVRLGSVLLRGLHRRIGPELDIMASGGAPLEPELAWTMEALGWRVAIGYGLTETSPILTINPPGAGKFHSVGRPLPGVELRIVDADKKGEDARGGEIQARGPGVFSGYRNLPDKTEEAFDEGGWYKTGDLGRMEDGWLVVNGRVSTLIVTSGGENVQPDALEQVLDRHSLLKESGVLERDGKVAALVRPDASAARRLGLEPEEAARKAVREAAESMPSYARPTAVAVTMHAIERTRLGKIRRHKLEDHFERAIQGADEQAREPMHPQEMQTEDRRLLEHDAAATAWELLAKRYPNRRLTPDSELAGDLGVDSLEWLDLTMELGAKAGVELDEEQIASIRTVRDLLRTVTSLESGRGQGPDPVREPEDYLSDADTRWLEPVTGWRLVCFRTMHAAFGPLARLLFRVRVLGLEHLDREGPLVITPNHLSYLDPILLAAALPFPLLRRTHFIGGQGTAFANPLLSFFSSTAQTIPIDPGRRPGASLALGSSVLSRGRNLVWFPEGLRSRTGELARFQPGLGRILAFRDALVVPVHIAGTYEAMPPGRWWIKPVQVSFTIGEPVAASTLRQDGECGEDESVADCVTASLRRRMERMAQ